MVVQASGKWLYQPRLAQTNQLVNRYALIMAEPTRHPGTDAAHRDGAAHDTGYDGDRMPASYRVHRELTQLIDGLATGTALQPERELATRFGVSRATIRQALQQLAAEGRLVRRHGSGTFVAPPKVTQPVQLSSFTADALRHGRRPTSRVLRVDEAPATADLAARLHLPVGAPITRILRLRLLDAQPAAVETAHLPSERVPGIADLLYDWTSLYALLTDRYGLTLGGGEQTIETVLATPTDAERLGTETGAPMLLITRTTWLRDRTPVEYVTSLYRGDRYRFTTKLVPPPDTDGDRTAG